LKKGAEVSLDMELSSRPIVELLEYERLIVELLEHERGFGCGMRFGKRKYANAVDEFVVEPTTSRAVNRDGEKKDYVPVAEKEAFAHGSSVYPGLIERAPFFKPLYLCLQ
jgi:hypothetical protein